MNNPIYYQNMKLFIRQKWINKKDKILVVCGGKLDQLVLETLGFKNFIITSISPEKGIKKFKTADVQQLPFPDKSYDVCLVHAGLHHCSSPHQGLLEMYRVAKKAIIVFEAQDSLVVRLLVKLKIMTEYESIAVDKLNKTGGVNNSSIPNYIYRWTKNEIAKTLKSFNPSITPNLHYYSQFYFHPCFLEKDPTFSKHFLVKILGKNNFLKLINHFCNILNLFLNSQGNNLTFIIRKK
jgi:SAM-dependent methyltransferase